MIFESVLDGFSCSRIAQLLENNCLHYIQSRMEDINLIPMNQISLIFL